MTTSPQLWSVQKRQFAPRAEQLKAISVILNGEGARLFLHPGKGKTGSVLKAFSVLRGLGYVDYLLVIAPIRVATTSWVSELAKWEDFADLDSVFIHGERAEEMKREAAVYLMNPEGLLSKPWAELKALPFLRKGRFMLAVDESTKFKNPSSARFKQLKKYLKAGAFTYPVIMTGTPKPKNLENLFSQCYITDCGRDLGEFITGFRRQYMMPCYNGFGFEPRPGAFEQVAERIAPTTVQVEYEEAVPSVEIPLLLPLPEELRAKYEELRNEFLTTIEDVVVMAPNSGVLFGKLRQLAQGALYKDVAGDYTTFHDAKLDALENLIEELDGEPLLVFIAYRHDVYRIRARLGDDIPYLGSGTSAAAGAAAVSRFSTGNLPILLAHPASAAHGVDGLQNNCSNVCWFGNDPSYENNYQGNLRIIRSGSTAEKVSIYRIMMDCSVEHAVLATAKAKQDSEAEFLALVRQHI